MSQKKDLTQNAHWTALTALPSKTRGSPSGKLAACQLTDNRIQLFVDAGERITTCWQRMEGGWTEWMPFDSPAG